MEIFLLQKAGHFGKRIHLLGEKKNSFVNVETDPKLRYDGELVANLSVGTKNTHKFEYY